MKIINDKPIENCFDGTYMREVIFDKRVDKNFIDYLSKNCSLDYYEEFPRPFFRISKPGFYIIKGIENKNSIKVYYTRSQLAEAKAFFNASVLSYFN